MDLKGNDIRLECFLLAVAQHREIAQVLETARSYEKFVTGIPEKSEKVEAKPQPKK